MYHRNLHPVIRELLSDFRIVYLTGPRQSGKSTLVRAVGGAFRLEVVTEVGEGHAFAGVSDFAVSGAGA